MNIKYCLIAGMAATVAANATGAQAQDIRVVVDGESIPFHGQPPIQVDDRVLVPLRGVFEDLGAQVNWNPQDQTVTARRGDTRVRLSIGQSTASVNGERVRLDVPAQVINDSTMVPLRFIGEALGDRVHWDEETQTVFVTNGDSFNTDHHDEGDYDVPHRWRRNEEDNAPPPDWGQRQDYNDDADTGPYRSRIVEDNIPDQEPPIVYDTDTVLPAAVDFNIDLANCYVGERISTIIPSYPGLPPNCRVYGVVREVGRRFRDRPPLVDLQFDSIVTPGGRHYHIDGRGMPFDSTTVVRTGDGFYRAHGPEGGGFIRADHAQRFGIRLNQPVRVQRESGRSEQRDRNFNQNGSRNRF